MIVLEKDNRPSPNCKGDGEGIAGSVEVKSQKDRLECSENNVSVSGHEEGRPSIEVKSQKDEPRPLYLDAQSTTPMDPRVLDAMLPYMTSYYGNPHSR